MKTILFAAVMALAPVQALSEPTCRVKVCNKLERFTLNPWSAFKDSMGKTCFEAVIAKSEAVQGKVLSEESRWYQGRSINPTKRSVTRVEQVIECEPEAENAKAK